MSFRFNPNCTIKQIDGEVQIFNHTTSTKYSVQDNDIWNIIYETRQARPKDELEKKYSKQVINQLVSNTILVKSEKWKGIKQWEEYNWKIPFFYYISSKNLTFKDEEKNLIKKENELSQNTKEGITNYKETHGEEYKLHEVKIIKSSVHDILLKRRTIRKFPKKANKEDLHTICEYGLKKLRKNRRFVHENSSNPLAYSTSLFSAFEIYIINLHLNFPKGIFHYNPKKKTYTLINTKDFQQSIPNLIQGQKGISTSSFCIIIIARTDRFMKIYRHERAYRDLLATCGELAQNLINAATGISVKAFMTPATNDTQVENLLKLERNEEVLYFLGFGK